MKKFSFNKFLKHLDRRQRDATYEQFPELEEETPQQKYNRLYREKWQNSTRYGRKRWNLNLTIRKL